jgi:hypothetical protein
MAQERDDAARAHAAVRATEPYQAQLRELATLTSGFLRAVHLAWFASTRDPATRDWLFWRFTDDLVASAVGIADLVREGIDRTARRELRFMLELVVRHLYVDTQFSSRETPLAARLAYLEHKLGKEDVSLLSQMPLSLYLADPESFKEATRRLYGELSGFTHPTYDQLARRLEEAKRGVYIGFETVTELESFTDLLRRAYDVLLVFVFEALGPSSTGDVYVQALVDWRNWPFHQTHFTAEVGRRFDYKLERRQKRNDS